MKKFFSLVFSLCFIMVLFGCNNKAVSDNKVKINFLDGKKILIAYYSYSGNTKDIAQKIQSIVGGDMLEILPLEAYSSDYNTVVEQAKQEKENNIKPKLQKININVDDYDVVFVGTPVWWGTIASPIRTFLLQYNLSKKTIIPFCTHGGGGESETFFDIKKLQPIAKILSGFSVYQSGSNNIKEDVSKWLLSLQEGLDK